MSYGSEKIRKLNAELDQFVYSCYHDLRAPIATILGLINVIKNSNNDDVQRYIDMIHDSTLKLDLRIKDIIDYSKNSRLRLKRQQIDLDEFIYDVLKNYQTEIADKGIEIKTEVRNNFGFFADKIRAKIILDNLISNAVNFQREGNGKKWIEVVGHIASDKVVITIEDNGIGISQMALDQVYDMFYKAASESKGAGLGLYIVKESLKKMNGDIKIQSNSARGTKVEVTIPNLL